MNTAYKEEIYSMVSNTNDTEILKKIYTFVRSYVGLVEDESPCCHRQEREVKKYAN